MRKIIEMMKKERDALKCPHCNGKVKWKNKKYVCVECGRDYKYVRGELVR